MDRENQDVVGEMCIKNDNGELALNDDEKMKAWVELYDRPLNIDFDWPLDSLPDVSPVEGPPPPVISKLINHALKNIKGGKPASPSGIVAEMTGPLRTNANQPGVSPKRFCLYLSQSTYLSGPAA